MNPNSVPAMTKAARTRRNLFRILQAPVTCGCGHQTLALSNNRRLCVNEECSVIWAEG